MARNIVGFLTLTLALSICCCASAASLFQPISDSHRSAASQLFVPTDGSFSTLEETYEALRTFEVLGVSKKSDVGTVTCGVVSDVLGSSTSTLKDLYYALRVNSILKCKTSDSVFQGVSSRLQSAVGDVSSLMDYHYSIRGLLLIKEQTLLDIQLTNADAVIRSIKALGQSDGRWRLSSSNPESSTYASGIAFETIAGVVSLASIDIDQTMIGTIKNDIRKLFESIDKYDDGTLYFDEKLIDGLEHQGPVSTTASVVRGFTAFASVTTGSLNIPEDKILGLAKYFLGIGIPGDARDLYNQVDSLSLLENNRVSIPLILSLPATVFSLTQKDSVKVRVSTVLGSNAPPLAVKLVKGLSIGSQPAAVIGSQELKFDPDTAVYFLDSLPKGLDVGKYQFVFEIVLDNSEQAKSYVTGGHIQVPIFITGTIKIDDAEISVLDSDLGNVETQKLNFAGENVVSFSANHLQKLRLSFQLATPLDNAFKPHQAFLKLKHESKVEHVFVVESSGKQFEIILDFLRLVEKLYYLSGQYEIQLTVGDSVMENSFIRTVGHIDLDLPERPEKAPRPPLQSVDPYSRYEPKAEITHIFRVPDKRPPEELSFAFLGLTLLPFIGFLIGLLRLRVNFKNFPSAPVPATFALLFHLGIAAVLLLYVLFWLKLDLFITLKTLGILGVFLIFVGHKTLSHLASTSVKLKSA